MGFVPFIVFWLKRPRGQRIAGAQNFSIIELSSVSVLVSGL
jgi:hypothetical protein